MLLPNTTIAAPLSTLCSIFHFLTTACVYANTVRDMNRLNLLEPSKCLGLVRILTATSRQRRDVLTGATCSTPPGAALRSDVPGPSNPGPYLRGVRAAQACLPVNKHWYAADRRCLYIAVAPRTLQNNDASAPTTSSRPCARFLEALCDGDVPHYLHHPLPLASRALSRAVPRYFRDDRIAAHLGTASHGRPAASAHVESSPLLPASPHLRHLDLPARLLPSPPSRAARACGADATRVGGAHVAGLAGALLSVAPKVQGGGCWRSAPPTTEPASATTADAPSPSRTPTPTGPGTTDADAPAQSTPTADALARFTPTQLADLEVTESFTTTAYVPAGVLPSVLAPTLSATPPVTATGTPSAAPKSPIASTSSVANATPTWPLRGVDTLAIPR
ncbi:hypothetical protein C8J57DRAFT_1708835 [Mycena rebaudengoi]|nr:hypothetical protein C8J57DRAFT_1708835 [Mycena rebaudengoi]